MSIHRLPPGGSTRRRPGNVQIEVRVRGGDRSDVKVTVVDADGREVTEPAVQRPASHVVVVVYLAGPMTIGVVPAGRPTFAHGVIVELTAQFRRHGEHEADQVRCGDTDVSGLPAADLLVIHPESTSSWAVASAVVRAGNGPMPSQPQSETVNLRHAGRTPTEKPVLREPMSRPSPELIIAQQAEYAARSLAGRPQVDVESRRTYHVVLDRTASMLPHVRAGAVTAVVGAIVGINKVFGAKGDVTTWVASSTISPPAAQLAEERLAEWIRDVYTEVSTGLVSAAIMPALRRRISREPTSVFLLTDGVPADIQACVQSLEEAHRKGWDARWHIVALAHSAYDYQNDRSQGFQRLSLLHEELRELKPLVKKGVMAATAVAPTASRSVIDALTDGLALTALVRALALPVDDIPSSPSR